jgi:hypothetical protein
MIAGSYGLKKDGTVISFTNSVKVPTNWVGIAAITTYDYYTIAINSDGTLIDSDGNEYKDFGDIIFAGEFDCSPEVKTIVAIRSNSSTFIKNIEKNVSPSSDYENFLKKLSDVILPSEVTKNSATEKTELARDLNKSSYRKVRTFTQLGGKYSLIEKYIGIDDCGYFKLNDGLMDSSGKILFDTKWFKIMPLTDDRFVLSTGNNMETMGGTSIIVDISGKQISNDKYFTLDYNVYNNEVQKIGIALANGMINGNEESYYYLVDFDGNRISIDNWYQLSFDDTNTIVAENFTDKDNKKFKLDTNGQIIK